MMAASKAIPRERLLALQHAYDTLCIYLGFHDDEKHFLRQILDGDFISPFFAEYQRDYLEAEVEIEDVDCDELFRWCRSKNAFALPKYVSSKTPSKGNWTALDHAARFLVRALRFSWENDGEWTHGKFDPDNDQDLESDREFHQVWAILRYLQIEWEAANIDEWGGDSISETLADMLSSRL
ncbi:hypothetical protein F4813DRAFT_373527 [Daldinia decipiens]|uniref:uncharacterized protein n=1 Tax=Daldinia decipiens TaxID=326647 RepID=UPI0020C3F304|nr:uncharacterized protein F4813DRAFT_373527 [Daldinia decipiens]KAI1653806.1 hypothetical protein F4813DRAFT_373527 [Daldinia decipiens]